MFSMNIPTQVLDFNITSLSPNVEYMLTVRAINRAGLGTEATAVFRTLQDGMFT